MSLIGAAAIGAASSLLGGAMNKRAANKASDQNTALQREFAQNGIRWRVADAKAAGLSPLAALGASGASFSPSVQVGSMGDAVSNMGQDISRAVYANASQKERVAEAANLARYNEAQLKLQTENMALQNDAIRQGMMAQKINMLSNLGGQLGPGMPSNAFKGTPSRSSGVSPSGAVVIKPAEVTSHTPGLKSVVAGENPGFQNIRIGGDNMGFNLTVPTEQLGEALEGQAQAVPTALTILQNLLMWADKRAKAYPHKSRDRVFPRSGKW